MNTESRKKVFQSIVSTKIIDCLNISKELNGTGLSRKELIEMLIIQLPNYKDCICPKTITNTLQRMRKNNEVIYENPVKGILFDKMMEIFNAKKQSIYFATNSDLFMNVLTDTAIRVQGAISSGIPEVREYKGESIIMASAFFDNEEERDNLMSLKEWGEVTLWHEGAVDIVPKGSTKSSGIDIICKMFDVDPKETMGFGDGENDISMLKKCGVGIAMGNATDELKQMADYITEGVDEDGIYNALTKYGVI